MQINGLKVHDVDLATAELEDHLHKAFRVPPSIAGV